MSNKTGMVLQLLKNRKNIRRSLIASTLKMCNRRVDAIAFILIELGVVLNDKYGCLQIRSLIAVINS